VRKAVNECFLLLEGSFQAILGFEENFALAFENAVEIQYAQKVEKACEGKEIDL